MKLYTPDFVSIFLDGSVAGELAGVGHVHEALLSERLFIGIIGIALELCVTIGNEIEKDIIMIRLMPIRTVDQRLVKITEHTCAAVVKCAVHQGIQHLLDAGVAVIDILGLVGLADLFDILDSRAEDIVVLFARLLHDFDVGAVIGAERHRAVEHELHVARAGSLGTRGGNLLGDVGGRSELFRIGNIIIGNERDREILADFGVGGDHLADFVDELDDALGSVIAGSSLCAEDKGSRVEVLDAAFLDAEVDVEDGERVEELTLVRPSSCA